MTRDIKNGLLFAALCGVIYAVAMAFMALGQSMEFNSYPQYVLPGAALAPLFFSNIFVRNLSEASPAPLRTKEHIVFALVGVLGATVCAAIAEANFLYHALKDSQDITYSDVLLAPMDQRYTVTVLFGASFMLSAAAVAGYICAIRIPATLTLRARNTLRAQNDTPPE